MNVNRLVCMLLACLVGSIAFESVSHAAPQSNEPASATPSSPRPWIGFQLQELDEPLTPFKPLTPRTTQEQNRIEALAWYGVGNLEVIRNNYDKAFTAFEKAYQYDQESAPLLTELVRLSFAAKKPPEVGYQYALKLVELAPQENNNLLRRLGELLSTNRDIPAAIQLYEKAIRSPNFKQNSALHVLLMKDLGIWYQMTQRPTEAARCFEMVFDALQNPGKYELNNTSRREISSDPRIEPEKMAEVFLTAGKLDLARKAFEKSAKTRRTSSNQLDLNLARVAMKAQNYPVALEHLEKFLQGPQYAKRSAYELLAEVLQKLNRESELIAKLEQIAGRQPKNSALQYYLADRYLQANRIADAETLYRKTLENDPDIAGYLGLCQVNRRQSKFPEYLEALGKAWSEKKDVAPLEGELTAINSDQKLWDELWKLAQQRMDPKQPKLEFGSAYVLFRTALKTSKTDAALALMKFAVSIKQDQAAKLYDEMGDHLQEVKRYKDAADLFKSGAEDPLAGDRKWNFYLDAAQAYELGGDTPTALKMIAEAKKVSPDEPANTYQEAWIYSHAGQYDQAIKLFEGMIAANPNEKRLVKTVRITLSNVYVQKGDIRKGEEILEVVLQESPDDPSVNNDLGYLYADQSKNLDKAEVMITKALKSDPENAAYLDSMGWVLYRRGKPAEALPHLVKSTQKSQGTGDATIWDHLGDVHNALKQATEANSAWTKALNMAKSASRPDKKLVEQLEAKIKMTPKKP